MPRKPLERSQSLPYHVTLRANNREVFPIPLSKMWELFTSECQTICLLFDVEIHAFVMMPNHIHMVLTTPVQDLGVVMNRFVSELTIRTNQLSGRSGRLFGAPYHSSLVKGTRYFGHLLKYVYRNPVKAKICERVQDYRYSTLHGLLGLSPLKLPIHYTRCGMEINLPSEEPSAWLDWLNRPHPKEIDEAIRAGLKRRTLDKILTGQHHQAHKLIEQFSTL